jgi:hypothetical protein
VTPRRKDNNLLFPGRAVIDMRATLGGSVQRHRLDVWWFEEALIVSSVSEEQKELTPILSSSVSEGQKELTPILSGVCLSFRGCDR